MKRLRIALFLLALLSFHESFPAQTWSGGTSLSKVGQWYRTASTQMGQGKYRKAIGSFKRCLRYLPRASRYHCTRARIWLQIGKCWRKLGRRRQARSAFRKAFSVGCSSSSLTGHARRAYNSLARRRPRPRRRMVHPTPKSAPSRPPSPSVAVPRARRALRRARRPRRLRTARRYRRKSIYSFGNDTISGDLTRPSAGAFARMKLKKMKKKGKKEKKPRLQVWQRNAKNTILSKVSVGGGKYLKLEKLRVNVQVEGMRVRTIIDHIYRNPYSRTLQGTFKYTLPPDASVSYYAMFVGTRRQMPRFFAGKAPAPRRLNQMQPKQIARTSPHKTWGKLREARLVPAEKGRKVYEEITRRRIDPALLEQDAPNTFTGRVFPIPARGFNRVIIAYEQTLPQLQNHHVYRFRFPPDVAKMIDFTLGYNPKRGKLTQSNLKALRCKQPKGKALLRCYWEQNKPKKDAVFYFRPRSAQASWLAGVDPVDSKKYLLAQLQVKLPKSQALKSAKQAIFMLDTSLSANPDLFGAHVALLKKILAGNASLKRFNVLFFDVGARWANAKGWLKNDAATRRTLSQTLDEILLEGATDLSAAMRALAKPSWSVRGSTRTDIFLLSDGQLSWGNRQVDQILYRFYRKQPWGRTRFFAYQMGIGSENLGLLRRMVRKGGGLFPCLNRAALTGCATAHTKSALWLQSVEVKGVGASQVLVAGRQTSVYSGALITLAAHYRNDGKAQVTLRGRYLGKAFTKTYALGLKAQGDLGPRAWGEMTVAQLLELEDPKLNKLVVAYAQHFIIPNKLCSFLVLETDKEYKQYGLDKIKKAQQVRDVAEFLARLWQTKGKPLTRRQRWRWLMRKVARRYKFTRKSSGRAIFQLLAAVPKASFELSTPSSKKIQLKGSVPKKYLKTRVKLKGNFDPFVREARRRILGRSLRGDRGRSDVAGAIRALSCITELHPANSQGLRLVGYYLRAWKRPKLAGQLFWRVLQRRSFEPHAFRDVAISMLQLKRYGLAALMYEVVLAGRWHSRFGQLKTLAREEYALLVSEAFRHRKLPASLRRILQSRKSLLGLQAPKSKLRVTVTWNTDNTDIDLWVTGPFGEKCYYSRRSTSDGGRLLQDITRGYGPERYQNAIGMPGKYKVQLHFYGHRTNVFGNETHASVLIVLNAGTSRQRTLIKNLVLKSRRSVVKVHTLKL